MSKKPGINVDDAYALETPDDSIELYRKWAATYDDNFVDQKGYVLHMRVAEALLDRQAQVDGPVLDVGCGTGVVGQVLRAGGVEIVDGIDISPEMLDRAGEKKTADGEPVYRELIRADLTQRIDIPDDRYGALVSAGTFTHGHLGPDSLDELWRIMAAGSLAIVSIRSTHYEALGFGEKLAADVEKGIIRSVEMKLVDIYSSAARDEAHARDQAQIVVCQVV